MGDPLQQLSLFSLDRTAAAASASGSKKLSPAQYLKQLEGEEEHDEPDVENNNAANNAGDEGGAGQEADNGNTCYPLDADELTDAVMVGW